MTVMQPPVCPRSARKTCFAFAARPSRPPDENSARPATLLLRPRSMALRPRGGGCSWSHAQPPEDVRDAAAELRGWLRDVAGIRSEADCEAYARALVAMGCESQHDILWPSIAWRTVLQAAGEVKPVHLEKIILALRQESSRTPRLNPWHLAQQLEAECGISQLDSGSYVRIERLSSPPVSARFDVRRARMGRVS